MGVTRRWRAMGRALLVALASAALLVACGDDDGERVLDAETAEAIARAALLVETDLPEANWLVLEGELAPNGEDLADEFFGGPECEALAQLIAGRQTAGDAEPLAVAGRGFQSEGGLFSILFVSSAVNVFATVEEAEGTGAAVAGVVAGDALRACFEEGLREIERQGIEIRSLEIRDPAASLDGSSGVAVDAQLFALFFTLDMQLSVHTFQRDHVVATFVTVEMNSDVISAREQQLLDAFETRVLAALEGN